MNGMRTAGRGFTLVEVLVALIIVALGSAAMLSALASSARAAERIRERMIAGFVAMNRLTETRLEPEFPGVGRREGEIEMGGSRWAWQEEVVRTPIEGVLQITVRVRGNEPTTPGRTSAVSTQAGWLVTIAGARGTAVSADPLLDRLWDSAQRSPP
jgi:general secretion pathway protein I